jgi:hypothetical protein
MPTFLRETVNYFRRKDTAPVNRYEGFTSSGAVIVRDRRGTLKAEIPNVSEKAETLGDDPLAIYKPSVAKISPSPTRVTSASTNSSQSVTPPRTATIPISTPQPLANNSASTPPHS